MPKIGAYGNLFQDHRTSKAAGRVIIQKRLEGVSEASLQFEPNAGNRRRFCRANDDPHIIAVTAERLEAKRVYLGPPRPRAATMCRQERCPPCGQNAVRGQPRASSTSIISR